MLKWFRTKMGDWALPAAQGPVGLKVDADFAPEQPGLLKTLFGWGSDARLYTLSSEDAKRLRPIILRDPRAIRNEEIVAAARRRRAARDGDLPIKIIGGMPEEYEALPQAEILPPVPRPVPDPVDWEGDIVMPLRGAGDGGRDK
jgi:hypothetical protein